MRIEDLLRRSIRHHPRVTAVDDGVERLTFSALAGRVDRAAGRLAALGVAPGDRVAVLAKNRAEYVALYFAVPRLGAALVPLNWRLGAAELRDILADCGAVAVLAEEGFAAVVEQGAGRERRVLLSGARAGWTAWDDCAPGTPTEHPARPEDIAVQMYTSGTSGRPKGAMLSHGNIVSMTTAWLLDMRLEPVHDVFLQVTPLFHVGGMLMVMSNVATGSRLRMLPEFDPVAAIDVLAGEGATHALLVPAMLQWMLREPYLAGKTFPRLRLIVYGASPIPPATLERALATFGCDFLQGYGLTESAGVLLTLRPEDHRFQAGGPRPERLGAAGRAALCCEVRVVDEDLRDVAVGEVGEIVARGDNLSPGYWNDPEATAEAWRGGWFHTGDLARLDDEGFVYVVDRSKDMILVGGENVYPREIEDVLAAHEDVAEAAVIGVPHDVWGEEVLALVVPRPGAEPDPRALVRHCRARLARFKCPTRVERRDALPRNAAGKVLKALLREPFWRDRERKV